MYADLKKLFKKCTPAVKKLIAAVLIVLAVGTLVMGIFSVYKTVSSVISVEADHAKFEKHFGEVVDAMADYDRFEDKLGDSDPFAKEDEHTGGEPLKSTYRVEFVNVGAADCTVLTNGDKTFVIDTGDMEDGTYIVDHLKNNGIKSVSVMLTNDSAKRIGGFEAFLSGLNVEELIVADNADGALLAAIKMANANNVRVRKVSANESWSVGEATITILSAFENIITRIDLQATSFLLMSDASLEEEAALLSSDANIRANVLKVSNNGSVPSDMRFVRAVSPKYTIVSCDSEISNRAFLNDIRETSTVFKTDKFGTLFVLTDGVDYKIGADNTINCNG